MERGITTRPANCSNEAVNCGQWEHVAWPEGCERWLWTSHLRSQCFVFAVVSGKQAILYHVNNDTPGKLVDLRSLFKGWWWENPITNEARNLYSILPARAHNDDALAAAKWFIGEVKAITGLKAREIVYAPVPQPGWATLEIHLDGTHQNTPQVYLNAIPWAPAA
jgi:hypothetical protein